MPYVRRENDKVVGVYTWPREDATEFLANDHPDVVDYEVRSDKLFNPLPNISDRQFFHALAKLGIISQTEALNAVKTGTLPQAFEALVSSLPSEQQFDARMLLEGANTFRRDHPLTSAFGQMYGMNEDQIDDLWKLAGSL